MTCIVGYLDKNTNDIYMGGDSAGVSDFSINIRKDPKVFVRDKFIFGFTSSFRMGQILMCCDLNLPRQEEGEDTYVYMVKKFVPAIKDVFDEEGYLQKYKDGDDRGGTFIVGYNNRLFSIEDDFQVGETLADYCSVGCGFDLALGSLYTSTDLLLEFGGSIEVSPEDIITLALEAASEYNGGVCKPFNIVKLKSGD